MSLLRFARDVGQRVRSLGTRVFGRLRSLGARVAERLGLRPTRVRYKVVEDLPEAHTSATLYVAGVAPNAWAASMLCPCGCKSVIELNLLAQAKPCWRVTMHSDGSASLTPSVWRTKGCRSHFWLRHGLINWC